MLAKPFSLKVLRPLQKGGVETEQSRRTHPNENGNFTSLLHRNLVENDLVRGGLRAGGPRRRMGYDSPFAALTAAQRFRVASAIAFLPAALIFHFVLAGTLAGFDGSDSPRIFAQRRC